MPRQKVQLTNDEIYHICLRAVGKEVIFKDEHDRFRMIFCIYEFNNSNPIKIWRRRRDRIIEKKREKMYPFREGTFSGERDCFVDMLAFCFMPNHIHLVARQLTDGGISRFMQKVAGGYAIYFNNKYKRKGHLFNQFKAIHITSDAQLKNVVTYNHCNPISIIEPRWKEEGIKNPKIVLKFLEKEYRWSSFFDYIGKGNFPSVTKRDFVLKLMGGSKGVRLDLENWVKHNEIKKFDYSQFEE